MTPSHVLMRNILRCIALSLPLLHTHAQPDPGGYDPLSGPWIIAWEDDFNGPAGAPPNASVWTPRTKPGLYNDELEYYLAENVALDGQSHLVLTSRNTSHDNYSYVSGWVDSEQLWNRTFGRFEIRAKLPTGPGIWPAHWLMPDYNICWPQGGEIDIMERINTIPEVHGALHWNTQQCGVPDNAGGYSPVLNFDPSADFHNYGIVWNETTDRIDYYVDDLVYTNATQVSQKFPQRAFYMILNTAIGGDWPGPPNSSTTWPQYHTIDYVRWYTRP